MQISPIPLHDNEGVNIKKIPQETFRDLFTLWKAIKNFLCHLMIRNLSALWKHVLVHEWTNGRRRKRRGRQREAAVEIDAAQACSASSSSSSHDDDDDDVLHLHLHRPLIRTTSNGEGKSFLSFPPQSLKSVTEKHTATATVAGTGSGRKHRYRDIKRKGNTYLWTQSLLLLLIRRKGKRREEKEQIEI